MNVIAKAAALSAAWVDVTGANPPARRAVLWPLAQADLETADGEAWGGDKGPHDWGATDLRSPNAEELAAIRAGTLKTGYWLHADGTYGPDRRPDDKGQLHLDSHPGGSTYAMWFAAFPDDEHGAAYYLRIVLRMTGSYLARPDATLEGWVDLLYEHGYFEGTRGGARPVGHRVPPLNAGEQANVDAYVVGCVRCLASIEPALAGWAVPGGATDDVAAGDGGVTSDAQQGSAAGGPGWENNEDIAPATRATDPAPPPSVTDPDETLQPL